MPENTEGLQELEDKITLVEREVDALQIAFMAGKKPWHREASTLIAFAALMFSFGTTVVSYYRTAQQDILASRLELRAIIKEMTDMQAEHAEMMKKYKDDPQTTAALSAQINTRNLGLANQAVSAIDRIEESVFGKGSVLSVEYIAVGTALVNSLLFEKAGVYFEEAARRATDPASATGAIRSSAGVFLVKGDVNKMRQLMQKAREIFSSKPYDSVSQITKDLTNATTETQWSWAEIQLRECDLAQDHKARAESIVPRIPDCPLKLSIINQLLKLSAAIDGCSAGPFQHSVPKSSP